MLRMTMMNFNDLEQPDEPPCDVTPLVPPFNHPIPQPHTPPTSLDEARQSYHLIGYSIRHLQETKTVTCFDASFAFSIYCCLSQPYNYELCVQIYKEGATEWSDTLGPKSY